jgi:hypothetical protein
MTQRMSEPNITHDDKPGDDAEESNTMIAPRLKEERPSVLPMLTLYGAAEPVATIATHCPVNGGYATSNTRVWAEKDKPTCGGLCPAGQCSFIEGHGVCTVVVPYFVPAESCPGFRH